MRKLSARAQWNTANAKKANEPFTADKIFGYRPPEKIEGTPVRTIEGSETEYNGQTWITLIPSEGEGTPVRTIEGSETEYNRQTWITLIPSEGEGTPVRTIEGSETEYNRQTWITLIPSEGEDSRIWEFSKTTGKIIQTAS